MLFQSGKKQHYIIIEMNFYQRDDTMSLFSVEVTADIIIFVNLLLSQFQAEMFRDCALCGECGLEPSGCRSSLKPGNVSHWDLPSFIHAPFIHSLKRPQG